MGSRNPTFSLDKTFEQQTTHLQKIKMRLFVLFILAFASKQKEIKDEDGTTSGAFGKINTEMQIVVKIEENEFDRKNEKTSSEYIGVYYIRRHAKWQAQRHSKNEKKMVYNGYYDTEEEAARASDTLARKLMEDGESHRPNFPDDKTEVHKKQNSSNYIGVSYWKTRSKWKAQRYSKNENKLIFNGYHNTEKTAAHASDTLASKLIENGEQRHKLNFPDDKTEVYKKRNTSQYIGVSYNKKFSKWKAQRYNKNEKKNVFIGYHNTEEGAAHASDTLAKKLIQIGENHRLNFSDENTEKENKRKRSNDLEIFQEN